MSKPNWNLQILLWKSLVSLLNDSLVLYTLFIWGSFLYSVCMSIHDYHHHISLNMYARFSDTFLAARWINDRGETAYPRFTRQKPVWINRKNKASQLPKSLHICPKKVTFTSVIPQLRQFYLATETWPDPNYKLQVCSTLLYCAYV